MYSITAFDDKGKEIANMSLAVGAFIRISEQGYNWFKLIDAIECNGGISGLGIEKKIKLVNLLKAMKKLKAHHTKGKWIKLPDGRSLYLDYWSTQKRVLRRFMRKCINWCILNNKSDILIGFY
ncbi:MAG: hypothetical protein ACFE8E_13950 [Candidatus Hodarchaeota archaeon]